MRGDSARKGEQGRSSRGRTRPVAHESSWRPPLYFPRLSPCRQLTDALYSTLRTPTNALPPPPQPSSSFLSSSSSSSVRTGQVKCVSSVDSLSVSQRSSIVQVRSNAPPPALRTARAENAPFPSPRPHFDPSLARGEAQTAVAQLAGDSSVGRTQRSMMLSALTSGALFFPLPLSSSRSRLAPTVAPPTLTARRSPPAKTSPSTRSSVTRSASVFVIRRTRLRSSKRRIRRRTTRSLVCTEVAQLKGGAEVSTTKQEGAGASSVESLRTGPSQLSSPKPLSRADPRSSSKHSHTSQDIDDEVLVIEPKKRRKST
jgi:hypothetical protein